MKCFRSHLRLLTIFMTLTLGSGALAGSITCKTALENPIVSNRLNATLEDLKHGSLANQISALIDLLDKGLIRDYLPSHLRSESALNLLNHIQDPGSARLLLFRYEGHIYEVQGQTSPTLGRHGFSPIKWGMSLKIREHGSLRLIAKIDNSETGSRRDDAGVLDPREYKTWNLTTTHLGQPKLIGFFGTNSNGLQGSLTLVDLENQNHRAEIPFHDLFRSKFYFIDISGAQLTVRLQLVPGSDNTRHYEGDIINRVTGQVLQTLEYSLTR